MRRPAVVLTLLLIAGTSSTQPYQPKYFGTVYLTTITADHVNVRSSPSLSAKVIRQLNTGDAIAVTGISESPTTVGSFTGYWLRCRLSFQKDAASIVLGWVYSQFIAGLSGLMPSTINVRTLSLGDAHTGSSMTVSVQRGKDSTVATVYPYRQGTQPFYSFTWSDDNDKFMYSDVPGTYIWYPESKKLVHLSYEGVSTESAWVAFTDDLKYAMEDFGTSPGPRGLVAWDVATGEKVFSGSYNEELHLSGHKIEVVVIYDDWHRKNGFVDAETERYAKAFLKTSRQPDRRSDGLFNLLIVVYVFDLDTKTRAFKEVKYIPTQ